MITQKMEIVCNKCSSSISYPCVKSQSKLIKFAKNDGWKILGNKHYCERCNG